MNLLFDPALRAALALARVSREGVELFEASENALHAIRRAHEGIGRVSSTLASARRSLVRGRARPAGEGLA